MRRAEEYRVAPHAAKLGTYRHRSSVVELSIRKQTRPASVSAGRCHFNESAESSASQHQPAAPPLAPPLAPRRSRARPPRRPLAGAHRLAAATSLSERRLRSPLQLCYRSSAQDRQTIVRSSTGSPCELASWPHTELGSRFSGWRFCWFADRSRVG